MQEQDRKEKKRSQGDLRAQIDDNLRRVYQEALQEELPERLTQLLEELRRKTGQ
ncbi:NepR family anti-sigma factor [Frigidibacter sp. SD6-1]|uniref:NepR family anti-sigma factor n=1 Tax=Frigidibacter sp. SD6-1 TaxID=3032581 RepID=UPI0024DFCA5E|nr:NepR family anti-sigma factor [Frigidibacter sp. SD6-1]